jgi:hypothetical protein
LENGVGVEDHVGQRAAALATRDKNNVSMIL